MWRAGNFPHCDYEVLPKSPWNYGLCIDGILLKIPLLSGVGVWGLSLFAPGGSHRDQGQGQKGGLGDGERGTSLIPEWNGSPPGGTAQADPYGCTNLRMTEMPILDD